MLYIFGTILPTKRFVEPLSIHTTSNVNIIKYLEEIVDAQTA